ncbi:aldehyde oxidase/xanthine dehydrogenase, middle subunit [Clostridium aceticum]|uniref:Aldehyde oxidase/xanthine dehydrogenase, middle subunit n=1 Tax=Clostridium aceticum TaxID=84022 RepID=A0A0D8I891_9CLOT|nr:FAD binding domain-containing protein [Clostridium aceticum]AKL94595.1 aldehyde oxidase/xanthine dehydrogenase, middle subunit [Clostridium aceticum]KJF26495.1 FAD-binding protein [Clostridium aceticum]
MFTVKEFLQPETMEEAYNTLINNRNNTILGGSAFLRMGSKKIGTAVDLSKLELNYIKDEDDSIEIGGYTTFRALETSPLLMKHFNGVLASSVKNIIGVQFRSIVTVGASVFSRYGFSDLITALLALDTEVELYKAGRMSLDDFLKKPYEKDILISLFIKKNQRQASYQDLRNSASDYPILNVAVSRLDHQWRIVVGARPQRAVIAKKASEELSNTLTFNQLEDYINTAAEELTFGTNERGTAKYRQAMCKVLVKRGIMEVLQCK